MPARVCILTSTSRPLFLKLLMRWFSKPAFSAMALRGFCVSSGFGDILRVKTKHGSSCAAAGLREGGARGRGRTATLRDAEGRSQPRIHARPGLVALRDHFSPLMTAVSISGSSQVDYRCRVGVSPSCAYLPRTACTSRERALPWRSGDGREQNGRIRIKYLSVARKVPRCRSQYLVTSV